jgi:RNA polymerase sigma-54 factor
MKPRSRITIQQTQRLTLSASLAASISVLRADAQGLSRYLEEQAAENPRLVLVPHAVSDWTPRWRSALQLAGDQPEAAAPTASLVSHVMALVSRLRLDPRQTVIAAALVEALEPSGWLGRPLAEIARMTGAELDEVAAVLARLQDAAEPTGLFARSLAECLQLQAREAGELDAIMVVVLDRLDLVASGAHDRLAREAGTDLAAVQSRIRKLRGYDPKPGAGFEPLSAPVREPDLLVERTDQGWSVVLNRSSLPGLAVSDAPGKGRAAARALIRMVESRNATLLAVGREILSRQEAALEAGPGALQPMRMAEVAEALGIHESTVSRVVAGTAIDTPRGTWWLRSLFSGALREGGPSAAALKDRLSRLIAEEDPKAPLGDDALAQALAAGGAAIARRTVAKYRAEIGVPPAHRRRPRP